MEVTRKICCVYKPLVRAYSTKLPGLLSDVNVLDLTRVIAGPFCSMMLGDLGANVIKVESLDGDEARKWGPPFVNNSNDSFYFLSVNRNKKSICIDLKSYDGKKIMYDLATKSNVMVENFLPGKLDSMQVGYEKLSEINPRLVYCAITGFGSKGPYSKKPGYDVIASAMGGLMNVTGEKNGNPVKVGVAITDVTTGIHAFGAIMTALYHRQKTGKGQKIDCNLLSTQISSMINVANIYLNCGIEGQRWGTAHANLVPYQAFKTKDGQIVIGAGSNAQFADLCKLINKEELLNDERFTDNSTRVTNRDELIKIISEVIETKTKKEWAEIFKKASFPNGPVNTMKDVFEDEHVKAIELVKELPHPVAGSVKTEPAEPVAVITLRPTKPQERKKVVWTEDTVDNENMNKKKSKCCCIYEKPRKFDESSSEEDSDECEHCFGHVERRKKHTHTHEHSATQPGTSTQVSQIQEEPTEPTTTVALQPAPTPAPAPSPPDKKDPTS